MLIILKEGLEHQQEHRNEEANIPVAAGQANNQKHQHDASPKKRCSCSSQAKYYAHSKIHNRQLHMHLMCSNHDHMPEAVPKNIAKTIDGYTKICHVHKVWSDELDDKARYLRDVS